MGAPWRFRTRLVQGPPGPGSDVTHIVPFTYQSAVPLVLQAVSAGSYITRAAIIVLQAFDGTSPQVQLGPTGSPALVMAYTDSNLAAAGQYETDVVMSMPLDNLVLTLNLSGATQGQGLLLYNYEVP